MTLKYHRGLSASPPGFEVLSLNWLDRQHSSFYTAIDNHYRTDKVTKKSAKTNNARKKKSSFVDGVSIERNNDSEEFKNPVDMFTDSRLETNKDRSKDGARIAEWERNYNCEQDETCLCKQDCKPTLKSLKKVLFADEIGKELTQVKIAAESSDIPPCFSDEAFETIKENLSEEAPSHLPAPWCNNHFHLNLVNFTQPNLDLLGLHQRVKLNGVALASISLQSPCNLTGSIEGRLGVGEDSKVMLRYTIDEWKSMEDSEAVCLSLNTDSTHNFYSFHLNIPSVNHSIKLEFAINLKTPHTDLWDNNNSLNYKVIMSVDSSPLYQTFSSPRYQPHHHPSDLESTVFFLDDLKYLEDNLQSYW